MQVGIIGVGLIGGSMAVDLKNRGFADRVVGVEADALHASAAKELGLVDEIVSYDDCRSCAGKYSYPDDPGYTG